MELHQRVRVKTRFDGGWSDGFAIAGRVPVDDDDDLYELVRLHDGAVLPTLFRERELRPEPGGGTSG